MNHLGIPVENQFIMNIRNYLWDLTFTLLICMSVLRLEPHSLEACSFTVSFEVGKYEFLKFVLFKNCFSYSECCISIRILGSFCFFFPQKSKLRFWQWPHLFCASALGSVAQPWLLGCWLSLKFVSISFQGYHGAGEKRWVPNKLKYHKTLCSYQDFDIFFFLINTLRIVVRI